MSYAEVMIHMADGRSDLASRNADELFELIESVSASEQVYCHLWIGMSRAAEGRIAAAKDALALCIQQASALTHSIELTEAHKIAQAHYLWVLALAGEHEKRDQVIERVQRDLRDSSGPAQTSMSLYWIGEAHRLTGKGELAIPCFEEALEIARLNDFPTYVVPCQIGLIGCHAPEQRDIATMRQLENELKKDGEVWRLSGLLFLICESQLHQEKTEDARETLQQLEERMNHWGHYVSQTFRLKGLLAFADHQHELGMTWLGKALRHALQTDFKLVVEYIHRDCQRLGLDSQDLG